MNSAANARLAMLVLFVALFAVVWHGDRPRPTVLQSGMTQHRDSAAVSTAEAPVSVGDEYLVGFDVPLPAALAPGQYVIVGDNGAVRSARFMAEDLAYLGVAAATRPADVTVTADGGRRWYFIRVGTSHAESALMLPDSPFSWGAKRLVTSASGRGVLDVRQVVWRGEAYCAAAMAEWTALGRTALDSARPFIEHMAQIWQRVSPPARLSRRNGDPRL